MTKSFLGFAALALLTPALPSAAADEAKGKALFEKKCGVCHGTDRATSKHKSAEEWAKIVQRMRTNGAQLTDEEARAVVGYLAEAHGRKK